MGTILRLRSKPTFIDAYGEAVELPESENGLQRALAVKNSVLIIQQMREVHTSIATLISKLENGDVPEESQLGGMGGMGGGMGGMGGGFGGSFFSVPERQHEMK
ncbi:MAG: hypothetical protein JWM11_1009 [Planctomycetaceae bacterium]|nr:hypothetical protein [Planctomycetaceae bacterium]